MNTRYKLMVSHNCGISYEVEMQSNNPEDFSGRIVELEKDILRWVIEKGDREITHFSSIHMNTFAFLKEANEL